MGVIAPEEAIDSEFNNVDSQIGQQIANRRKRSLVTFSGGFKICKFGKCKTFGPEKTPPPKTPPPKTTPAVDMGDGEFNNVGSQIGQQIGNAKRSTSEVIAPEDVIDDSEIANRQRRSLVGEEVEEVEDDSELINLDSQIVDEIGERQKRGLGWLNKQTPQKNCVTQKKCVNIPKKKCGIHKKQTCIPFPKKKCETKMIEKCQ